MAGLERVPGYFLQPLRLLRAYDRNDLRGDIIAGFTTGFVALPQGIAFAILAGLPPEMGIYSAIISALVASLWGSSNHLITGPTNAASLLIFSILLTIAEPGSPRYIAAAGMIAVMAGALRLVMGVARLGVLVNFISDSVIVGFTAGAGVLIVVGQLRTLLHLSFLSSPNLMRTVSQIAIHVSETHILSLVLGTGTILIIIALKRVNNKLPGPLIAMFVTAVLVAIFGLNQQNVQVVGALPRSLPPLAQLPLFDLGLIGDLSTGALAVAIIGLVEAIAISRSIASQSRQRLDSNQEFVGQGLANIVTGLFSGFPCSGSFNRSYLNYSAGAQTRLAGAFSGLVVLGVAFLLAPFAAYVPTVAMAGVLIYSAYGMVDRKEIGRIWQGARSDRRIMFITVLAALLLPLQFAVLTGILMSLVYYIWSTSLPRVFSVVPDDSFRHFTRQIDPAEGVNKPACPQLGILDIQGDLYFGAASHIEEAILDNLQHNPDQRFLMLRMHSVTQVDISGIHTLESIVRSYRERGGDVFVMRAQRPVMAFMESTGFADSLGAGHFLQEDGAICYLFHKVLDPAVCIYECDVRVFLECQNLPKRMLPADMLPSLAPVGGEVPAISPEDLWTGLRSDSPPLIVDVREPREFKSGHVPTAELLPLPRLLDGAIDLPRDRPIVLTCRTGRRSLRAAQIMGRRGFRDVSILSGGVLAWEAANLLEAIDV